jgi:hypothetical protein
MFLLRNYGALFVEWADEVELKTTWSKGMILFRTLFPSLERKKFDIHIKLVQENAIIIHF